MTRECYELTAESLSQNLSRLSVKSLFLQGSFSGGNVGLYLISLNRLDVRQIVGNREQFLF